MRILFVLPNKDDFGFKPIGLALLSGIARRIGWETKLFDTTEIDFGFMSDTKSREKAKVFKPVNLAFYGHIKKKINLQKHFIESINQFHPDCIAISVLSDEVLIASNITAIAKKFFPHIPIIWGGKYPTLQPERTLLHYNADFACIGEGIEAFNDFLNALSGKENIELYSIPNIWAKKETVVIKNSIRPLKQNLDDLPYVDWDLFTQPHFYKPFDGKVYKAGDHMLNWGCPHHCTYCINHFMHDTLYKGFPILRRYSVRRIIDELKFLKTKYQLEFLKFHDEDFLMRPLGNLRELSETYRQEVNLPFVIETNPKTVTREKVELLKNMNCVSVSLGVETGDKQLRKKILKRADSEEDIIHAFSLFKNASIRTTSFIMLGIPYETRTTYETTIQLLKKADVQYPNAGFFFPFEGTLLRQVAIDAGFFNPDNKQEIIYTQDKPALTSKELSEAELIEMRDVFILYVKLPKAYSPFIRRSETPDQIGQKLRTKILEIYDKTIFAHNGWYVNNGSESIYLQQLQEIFNPITEKS